MQITSFQQPSSTVTINAGKGVTWNLSGADISIHGDWRLIFRVILRVRDDGSFDASVSNVSISVSVTLGATPAGEPTISSTGCTCHIDRLEICLRGGASWLYNIFLESVEKHLRNNLERKICKAAQNAVNTDAARELATIPVKVPLGHDKHLLLDYRLVSRRRSHQATWSRSTRVSSSPPNTRRRRLRSSRPLCRRRRPSTA